MIDEEVLLSAEQTFMAGESLYIACLLLLALTFIMFLVEGKDKTGSGLFGIFWWVFWGSLLIMTVFRSLVGWFTDRLYTEPTTTMVQTILGMFLLIWIPIAMLYWRVLKSVCRSTHLSLYEKVVFVSALITLPLAWHSMQRALISGALKPPGDESIWLMAYVPARITFVTCLCAVVYMTWVLYGRQAATSAHDASKM